MRYPLLRLAAAAAALLLGRAGRADRIPSRDTAAHVYRSDARTPAELERQGGFLSRSQNLSHLSLFDHVERRRKTCGPGPGPPRAGCDRDSSYLWTTANATAEVSLLGGDDVYLYRIAPTPNFVDVLSTLGKFYFEPGLDEYAVLGDIRWEQVVEWTHLPAGRDTAPATREWRGNDKFDGERLAPFSASGNLYVLAGFPDGHQAWRESPWEDHRPPPGTLGDAAAAFLATVRPALDWPSLFEPSARRLVSRINTAADEAKKALVQADAAADAAACGIAASRAASQARAAINGTRSLASFIDGHRYPDDQMFERARVAAAAARQAAFQAVNWADLAFASQYRQQVVVAEAFAVAKDPGAAAEAFKADIQASLIQELVNKTARETADKVEQQDRVQSMLFAGQTGRAWVIKNLIWASHAETWVEPLYNEDIILTSEIASLRDKKEHLQKAASEAKEKAARAWTLALDWRYQQAPTPGADVAKAVAASMTADGRRPGDVSTAVGLATEMDDMSAEDQQAMLDIALLIIDIGVDLMAFVPSPISPVFQIVAWGRRAYRIYRFASTMATVLRVARIGKNSVQLVQKITSLGVRNEYHLNVTTIAPAPAARLPAGAEAAELTSYTFFTEMDVSPPESLDAKLARAGLVKVAPAAAAAAAAGPVAKRAAAGRGLGPALADIRQKLDEAREARDPTARGDLLIDALKQISAAPRGLPGVARSALDQLEEDLAAGNIRELDQDDDFSYSYTIE